MNAEALKVESANVDPEQRAEGGEPVETASGHVVEATVIPTDLRETEQEFVVRFDLPGVARDSLHVNWTRHTLQIEGRHAALHEGGRVHLSERPSGAFCRALPLPADTVPQGIRASYVDGVLTVHVPKAHRTEPHSPRAATH